MVKRSNFLENHLFVNLCNKFQGLVLLLLRLIWGFFYAKSGFLKFRDLSPVTEFFSDLGIPFAFFFVIVTALVHLLGGISLILGLWARYASIPLAFTMVVAYLTAYPDSVVHFFNDPGQFFGEVPFLFLLTNCIIIAFGPGPYSVENIFRRSR
jgi:putative oxidoreductase